MSEAAENLPTEVKPSKKGRYKKGTAVMRRLGAALVFDHAKFLSKTLYDVDEFRANRAQVLAHEERVNIYLQNVVRNKFTKDKIDEMKDRDAISLFDSLSKDGKAKFEMERLERGESTENVAVIVAEIKRLKREMVE